MSLWESAEKENNMGKINKEEKELSCENFRDKENRSILILDWIENNIINDVLKEIYINLQNLSEDDKEKILEIFTKNSKLLNSENSYLNNPIKGMKLISNIISPSQNNNKNNLETYYDDFTYIYQDFYFLYYS